MKPPKHIDYIEHYELRYIISSVDENGEAAEYKDDDYPDNPTPYPYTCTKHSQEFANWDEVKKHLEGE